MNLDLQMPGDVTHLITNEHAGLQRAAFEALALEVYNTKWFSEGQLRQMLRFSSRVQVHAFLKEYGVHLHYSLEDLEQDREISHGMIVVAGTSPLTTCCCPKLFPSCTDESLYGA